MSTVGAAAGSPMELFRMKRATEQHEIRSGVPTTIVRATAFVDLWIEILRQTADRSGRPVVFGRGQNPIKFVSLAGVVALVEHAVIDPATRGSTLEIGGPDNLTFDLLARAVQKSSEGTGEVRHVPSGLLHLMANSIGRSKPQLGRQATAALVMDRADALLGRPTPHDRNGVAGALREDVGKPGAGKVRIKVGGRGSGRR